ncbi:MAG: 50S ribosomal protein L10 [Lentisphaerae bacterium]|nr:50S ribosomal protein L10 [Lentisphaerota bacterium]
MQGLTDLRHKLRGSGSRLLVVQNSFLNLASKDVGWMDVEPMLDGPTAMITGTGEVNQVAKVLKDFVKASSKPRVKGGRFGTQTLTAAEVDAIASLPSREVLLQQVVGTIAAPMARLVGVLQQKAASVVYVLKAIEDKKSKASA